MHFQRRQLLRTLSFAFGSSFILSRNQLGIAALATTQPKVSPSPAGAAVRDGIAGGTEMEKVTGIGGFFFRAKDPKALGLWYQQHLGISVIPTSYEDSPWLQEAGPTAFAPFKETSDYFGDTQKVWMLNFRVRDLDKMAAQHGRPSGTCRVGVAKTQCPEAIITGGGLGVGDPGKSGRVAPSYRAWNVGASHISRSDCGFSSQPCAAARRGKRTHRLSSKHGFVPSHARRDADRS